MCWATTITPTHQRKGSQPRHTEPPDISPWAGHVSTVSIAAHRKETRHVWSLVICFRFSAWLKFVFCFFLPTFIPSYWFSGRKKVNDCLGVLKTFIPIYIISEEKGTHNHGTSLIVLINWPTGAGPFLIFPLGGFRAVRNTKRVISSSWHVSFVTAEEKHTLRSFSSSFFSRSSLRLFGSRLLRLSFVAFQSRACFV